MSNLRQLALACQAHVSALGIFPTGGSSGGGSGAATIINGVPALGSNQQLGWTYQILPYMGQVPLWRMANEAARDATALPCYFCPSRGRLRVILFTTQYGGLAAGTRRATNDYAGNAGTDWGEFQSGMSNPGDGQDAPICQNTNMAGQAKTVTPAQLVHGSSTTLLLGEKCLNADDLYDPRADQDSGWVSTWDMDIMRWGYVQPQRDYDNATEALNVTQGQYDWLMYYSFGSAHASSSNYAMCDGSVRPISYNVTLSVFMKLSSINWQLPQSLVPRTDITPIPMDF